MIASSFIRNVVRCLYLSYCLDRQLAEVRERKRREHLPGGVKSVNFARVVVAANPCFGKGLERRVLESYHGGLRTQSAVMRSRVKQVASVDLAD